MEEFSFFELRNTGMREDTSLSETNFHTSYAQYIKWYLITSVMKL